MLNNEKAANIIQSQSWQRKLSQFLDIFLDAQSKNDHANEMEYRKILKMPDAHFMQVHFSALHSSRDLRLVRGSKFRIQDC